MGIATGEADLRGDDYFGAVLNRAARVMAAGHGGQILVDGATAELAHRNRPDRSGATTITRHHQTGRPVAGSSVGLRTEFPPLRTVDATPGNLRTPTTSFVGRETELAELRAAPESASVGDVDRCRRSRQDPPRDGGRPPLGTEYPDGVFVIELAPVGDPTAVPEAVAAVLGITQQPGMTRDREHRVGARGTCAAAGVRQLRTSYWTAPPT